MTLEIHQVVAELDNPSSGVTYLVTRLHEALEASGFTSHIHSLLPETVRVATDATSYYKAWRRPRSLAISPSMKRGLRAATARADILHAHGLWRMPNIYPADAVRGTGCELIYSPNGMLEPWALQWSRRKKKVFWSVAQKRAVEGARCLHATSEQEADHLRDLGLTMPIAIVPVGVDIPQVVTSGNGGGQRTLLFLSRLHPKKNVDGLLAAWSILQHRFPEWRLDIAGSGSASYVDQLRQQVRRDDIHRVRFLGECLGSRKAAVFASADLFVLPTHSENFGIVIAEALSYGIPVITTKAAPWEGLETTGSGWWIEPGGEVLLVTLDEAMSQTSGTLGEIGLRGRSWVEDQYSWSRIGALMADTYGWLTGGGPRPPWVQVQGSRSGYVA